MAPKKVKKNTLTEEQRRHMLLTPCKTEDEFRNWIRYHLGLSLPDCTVSRYADTNPFKAIWEIYRICVLNDNPEDINELLLVAGRGSGKTLGMAIIEMMIVLHDQRDIVHVGAVQAQADRCYNYIKNFLYNRKLKSLVAPSRIPEEDRILEKANMSKSIFNVNNEKITLEVLPCTLKACNGPHVPLVVVDEIDTVSGEGLKAFKEISGMLDSKGTKTALRIGISTRKSRYGLMNQQIENAVSEGRTVRKWTAFEFSERCSDERSGTDEIDLYILQEDMITLTEEEFNKKAKQKQSEFAKHRFPGSKCASCKIAPICLGDAKRQCSTSPMLKPITDIIAKVSKEGSDWALAQLMNLKPSVEGIIYREFDERMHVKDWNGMWKQLVGIDFPGECTHDLFVKKCHEMKIPCYAGVDWGWSSPNTVVYFFIDKKDNVYVVRSDGMTYVSQPTWIHHCKTKYQSIYRCQLYFPDVADQGAVEEMKKAGLPVASQVDKAINTGIQVIKKLLRVPGSEYTKMFIARETCIELIQEFGLYHFKTNTAGLTTEDPEDEFNHWLDAFRYPLSMLLGQSTMMMSMGEDNSYDGKIFDAARQQYFRTPTAGEYAETQGIKVNEVVDTSKLGKIGTATELEKEEEEDDDGLGGSGGFLWSV
jgi:hypothetical protein